MMTWIVGASLRFRLLVVPIAAMLMIFGVVSLRSAKVDVLPEFDVTRVQVQTEALGLSAAEVEQLVTVPLEQDLLNGVAYLDEIHSVSVAGLSSIDMIFEPGTDVMSARQVVQERLTQAHALPNVSAPPLMLQPLSSTNRVLLVGLSATDVSALEMSVLARWRIKPRLMGVPGVANVAVWGQRDRQLQVLVDPQRLRQQDVTLNQVVETAANALWVSPLSFVEASTPGTGGFIDTPNQRLGVRHVLPITTPDELARVIVEKPGERPLRLGDVADVVESHQPLIGDALIDGGPGLLLVVEKFPGADTVEVTRQVEAALEAMRPGLSGIEMSTNIYRPASYVEASLGGLGLALLLGGVLLLLLVALLLFDPRAVVIAASAVFASLVAAALVLKLGGVTFNLVVLAGLTMALALVVADVVGDLDARSRERSGAEGPPTLAEVTAQTMRRRTPLLYAVLIVAAAAIPALFATGLSGEFLRPLARSYLVAVAVSMVVALTLTPALTLLLGRGTPRPGPLAPAAAWVSRWYERTLERATNRRGRTVAGAAVVLVAGVAMLPWLSSKPLVSPAQDRDLMIGWEAAPGTSQPEMIRITDLAINQLRALPGVRSVGAHIGRAVTSDRTVDSDSATIWLSIDPAADYQATVDAVRQATEGYPGISSRVLTYADEVVAREREDTSAGVMVRVYGQDDKILATTAEQVRAMLAGVEGATATKVEQRPQAPTIEVEVDLAAAQAHGIKPGDVRRAAATLLSGIAVGSLFEDQKVFDVVVWGDPGVRQNLTGIRNLVLDTPSGGHVRLDDVATVRVAPTQTGIRHYAVSRYLDVTAEVSGRGSDAVAADMTQRLKSMPFPIEYHAEVLTTDGAARDASTRTWWLGLAAAIAVLLLLQAALGSWRVAGWSWLALTLPLAGGALAGALFASLGGAMSSLALLAGLLAVLGLAARDQLMVLRGPRPDADAAPAGGVPAQLVGSVAVALALLPLVLLGNRPGFELVRPMAMVILGGLVASVYSNLFVLPGLLRRSGQPPAYTPSPMVDRKA